MFSTHLLIGTERGLYRLSLDARPATAELIAFDGHEVDPVRRDAGDAAILYANTGEDGLWRTDDRGKTWARIWTPPAGSSLYTLLSHPVQSGVLYAGLEPAAVWISRDGGRSWTELRALQTVPDRSEWRFFRPRQAHVRALAIPPDDGDTLYVGIEEGGVYVTKDAGRAFQSRNAGIYRDIHQICPVPGFPALLLASTGDGLYRSDNAGEDWRRVEGLTRSYTVPLQVEPLPPHWMYAAAAAAPPPSWRRGERGADAKFFRSEDQGLTWRETMQGFPSPQKGMIYCLLSHPDEPSRLFAGTTDGKIYESPDKAEHWRLLAEGLPEVYALAVA